MDGRQGAEYMALLARLPLKNRPASSRANGLIGPAGSIPPTTTTSTWSMGGSSGARTIGDHGGFVPVGKPMFGDENLFDLDFEERPVSYFVASVDWGFSPDPGVFQIHAIDEAGRAFLVKEWMVTEKELQWWAELIVEHQNIMDIRAIVLRRA